MKLALIGWPIKHSLSPKLYGEILGSELESYDLLPFETPTDIPSLADFSDRFDGINITSPYKRHFIGKVKIESPIVSAIKAVNTLAFTADGVIATNTDVLAVEEILKNYQKRFPRLHLIVLGSGVMAMVTKLVAEKLNVSISNFSRKEHGDISKLDLRPMRLPGLQNIIVNTCSRDFIFEGELSREYIFWDYNYSFSPHSSRIPSLVKSYDDGQEMLKIQAIAAVRFWKKTKS